MKLPTFDLTTPCTLCAYEIKPNELMRPGWNTVLCPECRREFALREPKAEGLSTVSFGGYFFPHFPLLFE
jgi:hypothetical protein